ncbi:uncharacterized protein JCM15063_002553 [Sporobolomyces koalae]|uniref:uncharacterized protein n=1 Tax=Sporobolomyces koalae TaxID=500713 RepID=UPI003181A83D
MSIPSSFGFETTAIEASKHYRSEIEGKKILITGVSPNGLGAEAAIAIAQSHPKLLILAGRSADKIKQTQTEINKVAPDVETKILILDLASFKAARAAGEQVLSWNIAIDVLINNAGVMAIAERTLSEDGFEMQFASNHLGPFVFTNTILPALRRSSRPRVVVVSSIGHHASDTIYDDPKAELYPYDKAKSYAASKTANIQFAVGLTTLAGINAVSLHPGPIRTEIFRHLSREDELAFGFIKEDGSDGDHYRFKNIAQGGST